MVTKKLTDLKPGDRVQVRFMNKKGDKTFNTGYVTVDFISKGYASFKCDNGLDKYSISINKIVEII